MIGPVVGDTPEQVPFTARDALETAAGVAVTKTATHSLDDLSRAAGTADRGGLTVAGRALQKHGGREGSTFSAAKGNPAAINQQSQNIVDEILTSPGSTTVVQHHAQYDNVTEIRGPDGRGVRYDTNGNFMGFLEPNK